jgi:hypothetical protein
MEFSLALPMEFIIALRQPKDFDFCHCEPSKKARQSRNLGGHSSFVFPQLCIKY